MYICITLGLLIAGIVIFFIWRIVDSKVVVYPLEAPSSYSSFGEFAVEWFIGIVFPLMSAACLIGGMVAFRTGSEKQEMNDMPTSGKPFLRDIHCISTEQRPIYRILPLKITALTQLQSTMKAKRYI